MNIIKSLTPEQLKALSPECLAILMNDEHYEEDIKSLNRMLDEIDIKLHDHRSQRLRTSDDIRIRHLPEIQKILSKYPNKQFYVMYSYPNTSSDYPPQKMQLPQNKSVKATVYSETDIGKIVTVADLGKISYYGGEKPYDFVDYPPYYGGDPVEFSLPFIEQTGPMSWGGGDKKFEGLTCITQLANQFDNLWFIHPKLLKYSKIYRHFSL